MQKRITLGRSGLEVTPICYGCWQMGQTFWGKQPRDTLIEAVHAALDCDINFFDTADAYGDGEAERILGEALRDVPRDQVAVATKVFHHFYPDGRRHSDLSKDYVLEACDASLQRLGMDYIDLYQAHAWETFTPIDETIAAFEQLVQAGKIRAYGVSNFSAEQLRTALRFGNVSTIQPYYNFLEPRGEEDLLPLCRAENIGVLIYSPLLRGILTGKFKGTETFDDLRGRDARFKGEKFRQLIDKVEKLRPMAEERGVTLTQLVLAATMAHAAIHCAIVGIKNAGQIREAAGAMDVPIDLETYYAIRRALG
jgi:aryl-alcohol dehydrogenase-like predicted oxidoreductase